MATYPLGSSTRREGVGVPDGKIGYEHPAEASRITLIGRAWIAYGRQMTLQTACVMFWRGKRPGVARGRTSYQISSGPAWWSESFTGSGPGWLVVAL